MKKKRKNNKGQSDVTSFIHKVPKSYWIIAAVVVLLILLALLFGGKPDAPEAVTDTGVVSESAKTIEALGNILNEIPTSEKDDSLPFSSEDSISQPPIN